MDFFNFQAEYLTAKTTSTQLICWVSALYIYILISFLLLKLQKDIAIYSIDQVFLTHAVLFVRILSE